MRRYILGIFFVLVASVLCFLAIQGWASSQTEEPDNANLQAAPLGLIGIGGTLVLSGLLDPTSTPAKRRATGTDQASQDPVEEKTDPDEKARSFALALTEVGTAAIAVGGLTVALLQFRSALGLIATLSMTLVLYSLVLLVPWIMSWNRDG